MSCLYAPTAKNAVVCLNMCYKNWANAYKVKSVNVYFSGHAEDKIRKF